MHPPTYAFVSYEPSDEKTDLIAKTVQCRKVHLKVGEFTHWCVWTTKLQTVIFQSNIGLSGQSKYVNRRENSKESNAASAIAARCCVPEMRSLQDTSRHFAFLHASQTLQTWGFPHFQAIYDLGNRLRRLGSSHCIFTKKIGRPGIMEMEMASDFRVTAQV